MSWLAQWIRGEQWMFFLLTLVWLLTLFPVTSLGKLMKHGLDRWIVERN